MAYTVDNFSGTKSIVIEDGTVDSTLDIRLIGKNYAGYGEIQNENFYHLLENFAGNSPPTRPVAGQLWYDTITKRIKFYDNSAITWRSTGSVAVGPFAPEGALTGDLWYNTEADQLYVKNTIDFTLVGPEGVQGYGLTRVKAFVVKDTTNIDHAVLVAYVNDAPMFVISSDVDFTLKQDGPEPQLGGITKFGIIKRGITFVATNNENGVSEDSILWATSSNTVSIKGGSLGAVPYQSDSDVTTFVPPNISTTRKILSQTGTGSVVNSTEWTILPTFLPISKNDGSILNIPLSNGSFPVLKRTGEPITIMVQ